MIRFTLTLILTIALLNCTAAGKKYVSIAGNDNNTGATPATAYRHISVAIGKTPIGDTLFVVTSPTAYNENGIRIINPIIIQKFGTGEATIDASGLTFDGGTSFIIAIINTSKVVIDGLTIKNGIYDGAKGIWILQNSATVAKMRGDTIRNCTFTNIGWISNDLKKAQYNNAVAPSAIKLDCSTILFPLSAVAIIQNKITNCALGYGEAITVLGNVDTFSIKNNIIDSTSNIGIDATGNNNGSGVANPALNQARNGVISGNTVSNCMSGVAMSAGIYLDGARNCIVENNKCFRNGAGISLGAEQSVGSNFITGNIIRNNLIYSNSLAGLVIGSGSNNNTAIVTNYITGNSLYNNVTAAHINGIDSVGNPNVETRLPVEIVAAGSAGEVLLHNCDRDTFQNNIIYPSINHKAIVGMSSRTITNFGTNYNLYYHDDGTPLFFFASSNSFNGVTGRPPYNKISDFTAGAGQETNSTYGNPGFVNPSTFDLNLTGCSFAINKGNTIYNTLINGQYDFTGTQSRLINSRLDCGAYEYQSAVSLCSFIQYTPLAQCSGTISQVKLSWSPSANATGYDVYKNNINITSVTDTTYTDVITSGGNYIYLIKARLGAASQDNSNGPQTIAAANCTPFSAFNLAVKDTCEGIKSQAKLSWTASTNATSYSVYKDGAYVINITGLQYKDSVGYNTIHTYFVKAKNNFDSSNNTNGIIKDTADNCNVTGLYDPADNPFRITISPNPATSQCTVTASNVSNKDINIKMINVSGQVLYTSKTKPYADNFSLVINLDKVPAGNYFVRITISNKDYIRKIVKQ